MGDIDWKEIQKFIGQNVSLLLLTIPFIINLLQIKISFQLNDYQTYLWILVLIYGCVTYGYSCDHIHDLHMFVFLFTVQVHSAIFFFKQTIFQLTPYQKIIMTVYLISICLFMNIMIRQYKGKKNRINENKLLFFTNQCSGTLFAQLLFLEIGVFDFKYYKIIFEHYPFDLFTYVVFNLLSIFGFFVGLFLLFQMEKYKESYYDLQKNWFYFTSLFAFLLLIVLKWNTATLYELYILISTYFYFFILIAKFQSKTWFFVISIITGITQIVIQIKYQGTISDVCIHICASINNIFLTRSLGWLFTIVYQKFCGKMTDQQKDMVGLCFEM